MVRAFAHGAMGRRIDPSLSYFSFQPVLHTFVSPSQSGDVPASYDVKLGDMKVSL